MNGGEGEDTYFVDDVGDVIIDSSGTDTVISSITSLAGYTLPAATENLTLIGKNSRSLFCWLVKYHSSSKCWCCGIEFE
jgi:Ca2+-binding RTX toxin-like protein